MRANQPPWPRQWLMTDERIGERLWQAMAALPEGAGVVFRHYATPQGERYALAEEVAARCRQRNLTLAVAGDVALARKTGADLAHNPRRDTGGMPQSRSSHSLAEAKAAWDAGATLLFLGPINATRSHPGRAPLPREEARRIVAACPVPVIALGGMDQAQFDARRSDGFYGWAAIDAWLRI